MTIKGNRRLYIFARKLARLRRSVFRHAALSPNDFAQKFVLEYVKIKVVDHIARTTCKCAGFEGLEFI